MSTSRFFPSNGQVAGGAARSRFEQLFRATAGGHSWLGLHSDCSCQRSLTSEGAPYNVHCSEPTGGGRCGALPL